jgi:hypothetical protein
MTQEQLIMLLLTLTLQACIDEVEDIGGELKALHTFLVKSHVIHRVHPSFRSGALSDWVDRLRQGIQGASKCLVSPRRRRPVNSTSNGISPAASLSTPSSSFMALMMDALGNPEETPIILESKTSPPRYSVERINNHGYHKTTRRFQFSVS